MVQSLGSGRRDGKEPRKRAVVFELEYVATAGRQAAFEVVKRAMKERDLDVDEVAFSRYCLHPSPKQFVPSLLEAQGKRRVSEAKLVTEVSEGLHAAYTDGGMRVSPGLEKALRSARDSGALTGALTSLDEGTAAQLCANLGLKDLCTLVLSAPCEEAKGFPTADGWLKLAKRMGVVPPLSVALVSSATACRSALSAGMRCVAVPDQFTRFQDFGGADSVVEDFDAATASGVHRLLGLP